MPDNCAIRGCKNVQDASKGISFHTFPKDKTIQGQWVEFVNKIMKIKGIHKRILTPPRAIYLCSTHFEDSDFSNMMQYKMGFAKRLLLKKEAVPSIYEVSAHEPAARKIIRNKIIQKEYSEDHSMIVSHNNFTPYGKEICQAGEQMDKNNTDEEFSMLQQNISQDGLEGNLDDDIKIEEFPMWEDKSTVIDLLDKEKIITMDYTARRQISSVQITRFYSSDSTHEDLENIDKLKQPTSQNISLGLDKDANKKIENEVKYPEHRVIDSKRDKFENHKVIGIIPENDRVLENTPENHEVVGNTLEDYKNQQNNLENYGVIRNTPENYGVYENIPGNDEVLRNTPEDTCSNNSQMFIMKNDEPINDESSMCILDDYSTSKDSNNIHKLNPKNKRMSQKGYKDMILIAISSLHNNKDVSESSIYEYIYENFAHGGKNEEVISQCVRNGIKELLSTGFIVQNGNKFETNLESFLEIKRKYKDIILEAIASSTDPIGSNLTCIRNYLCRKKHFCSVPFIRRCVAKLLSTGEIVKIGSRLKVSNIQSEDFNNGDNIKEIEKENLNSKTKNLENKCDSKNLENIIEIEKENSKSRNKNPKEKLDFKNAKNIRERENSKPRKKTSIYKLDSINAEKVDEDNYRIKYVDMILSETEFNKKVKDKIFNEDNYVDCKFKDCDLIVYNEHIEKHLQDHKSSKAKKYSIKMKNKQKFKCAECGQIYVTFYSIANHIFTHFNDKAPNERVCNECGYKNKRLSAFKIHKCNNLKKVDENSSKVLKHKDQLDDKSDQVNEKEMNEKLSDKEYNPSSNDEYYSSDNGMGDINKDKQSTRKAPYDMLAKLKVTCTKCQEQFKNEALCKNHLKRDHDIDIRQNFIRKEVDKKVGIGIYMCLKCNKIFHNIGSCQTHISVNHSDIEYHCDQCEFVSCRKHLLSHIHRNHEYQISVCKICKKFHKNKELLRVHMFQTHPSNPRKTFLCNSCGKIFKTKGRLDLHMLIHTGEKPFACKLCKFSTIQKYNLVVHMRSHKRGTIKTLNS